MLIIIRSALWIASITFRAEMVVSKLIKMASCQGKALEPFQS